MSYYLGVDVGATKSHALIVDDTGQALGFGAGGAGNPEGVGYDGLTEVVCAAAHQAVAAAGIVAGQIGGAGFGIAGYDWPSQREATLRALAPLELNAPLEIANDATIGLLVGASEGWGVAVVAGTGCNCRGRDRARREGRALGFGESVGEGAGASDVVARAVRGVAREWTRRGPATRLTQAFIALTGARDLEAFLEGLTTERFRLEASAAPVVFRVAAEGDAVAREVILWAGRELGDMANGVIRQLGFESLTFEVVLVGSLYDGSPLMIEAMRETIHALAPGARLVRLHAPPVVGGALLGMEQAGMQPSTLRETLIHSTNELLKRAWPSTHLKN